MTCVSPRLAVQALTAKQEEEARQLHSRLQHNKQQLALYYKAQEAARAEAQAAATLQAEEEAAQVCCRVIGWCARTSLCSLSVQATQVVVLVMDADKLCAFC